MDTTCKMCSTRCARCLQSSVRTDAQAHSFRGVGDVLDTASDACTGQAFTIARYLQHGDKACLGDNVSLKYKDLDQYSTPRLVRSWGAG